MILPPRRSTLFPYTTLFRSHFGAHAQREARSGALAAADQPHRLALRSEEHTSELQSLRNLVCRLLLVKKQPTSSARKPEKAQGENDDGRAAAHEQFQRTREKLRAQLREGKLDEREIGRAHV